MQQNLTEEVNYFYFLLNVTERPCLECFALLQPSLYYHVKPDRKNGKFKKITEVMLENL